MEIIIGLVIVVGIVILLANTVGQASLDKPIEKWTDDELARRLPKYWRVLSAQMKAEQFDKTSITLAKIKEIESEITKRLKARQEQQSGIASPKSDPFDVSSLDGQILLHAEEMLKVLSIYGFDVKAVAKELFDVTKTEAVARYGDNIYATSTGDRLITNEEVMSPRRAAGLTSEEVQGYWNRPPLLLALEAKIQEHSDFMRMHTAKQQGKDLIAVAQENRRASPIYGSPVTWNAQLPANQGFNAEDADLYPEFIIRVGRWQERTPKAEQQELLKKYSSFNAMIRGLIREGTI